MASHIDNLVASLNEWLVNSNYINIFNLKKFEPNLFKAELYEEIESFNLKLRFEIKVLLEFHFSTDKLSNLYTTKNIQKEEFIDFVEIIEKNRETYDENIENIKYYILDLMDEIEAINEIKEPILHNPDLGIFEDDILDTGDPSIPSKIVLLHDLGIYDLLRSKIDQNDKTKTSLAKLISYVIGEKKYESVLSYLDIVELNPSLEYQNPKKSPFTHTAVKKMKAMLSNCNLMPSKEYPDKNKSKK